MGHMSMEEVEHQIDLLQIMKCYNLDISGKFTVFYRLFSWLASLTNFTPLLTQIFRLFFSNFSHTIFA